MADDVFSVELTQRLGSSHPENRRLEFAFEAGVLVQTILVQHRTIEVGSIRISRDAAGNPVVTASERADLACPYCGSAFETELTYTASWSEHRDLTGFECENYLCDARWDRLGKLERPSKLGSPGGDDEAQASSTKPAVD